MPELCRFYGIVIRMYFDDHLPPHFHAIYGEDEALVSIETLALVEGRLPPLPWAWWLSGLPSISKS